MNEGQNHVQHPTGSFVLGKLARSKINVNSSKVYKQYLPIEPAVAAEFRWPKNEFNDFVISRLTTQPNKPYTISDLINSYNTASKSYITINEGTAMFDHLYSYLRGTGVFFVKHKSIPQFQLTCCSNQYTILNYDANTEFLLRS